MESIIIQNTGAVNKTLLCAPDKSITHRAVMFNALTRGTSKIEGALLSDDCLATIDCAKRLGAEVEIRGGTIRLRGADFKSAELYCANSGTTMRLLCGILAPRQGLSFELSGDESLSLRPMSRVANPLKLMGADIQSDNGRAPLRICGCELNGIDYVMDVASAQVKSAVLLAGLGANGKTTVTEPAVCRDHTERMLAQMGADIISEGNKISVKRSVLHPVNITVAGDISAAAYPLCLAAALKNSCITVKNVGINPTRSGLIDVFDRIGADIKILRADNLSSEPTADIQVRYRSGLKPFNIGSDIMPRLIDEVPVLAALACFIEGESVISGAAELRVKESDRIKTTVTVLSAMGADICETEDGMVIRGGKGLRYASVNSFGDHRIAMAASIAARAGAGAEICGHSCASVSYPDFYSEVVL